ncbi:NAD/NADP octopine/nopaline dehydrogenase family protein [Clostridium sp. HCP1S3_B4]|uniref:NAD/NADP octopine/nopaline dehydrogenase family protein n=1 Tax=unclassified Clostridium TaxID=2614128 RepID=UPI003F8BEDED
MFYEKWTDDSSEMLIACDKELQELCDKISLNLESVKSLTEYYESSSASQMTHKIRNIKAFKGLTSPMKKTKNGWVPDFTSRYFKSDFSFGLKIIKDIAEEFDLRTPNIDTVWKWYEDVALSYGEEVFKLNTNKEEFVELYTI